VIFDIIELGNFCWQKGMLNHMNQLEEVTHTLEPIFDCESKILILGTFPSVKSREGNFYYHNPKNRFWHVLAEVFSEKTPETILEKEDFLHRNHIAIWDVVKSCQIKGSDDSSISNVVPNDFAVVLNDSNITKIYSNGGKAADLFEKYCYEQTGIKIEKIPSTSPANAAYSLAKLVQIWKKELTM